MKFKFRLEQMLKFIHLRESTAKMEVAQLTRELLDLEQQAEDIKLSIEQLLVKSRNDLAWAPYGASQVILAKQDLEQVAKQITEAQDRLDVKKMELSKASMRRKAMENLREKKRQEFNVKENRKEQKQLDEFFQISKVKEG